MLLCTRDAKENMAAAAADPADDLKHALSGTSGGIPPMAEKHHLVSELWRILNYGGEEDIEVGSVLSRASDEDDKEDIRNWAGRPLIAKAKAKSRDVADMVLAIAPLLSRLNVYPGEVPRSEKTEKEAADAVVKVYNAAVRVCEEKAAAAKNKGIKAVSIKIPALERVVDLTARAVQCPGFGCGHPCAQPLLTDAALTAMNVIGEAAHKNAMAAWSGAGSTGPKPRRTGKSGHYTMAFVCQCSNQNCHGNRDGTGCVRCVANKGPFLNPDGQGPCICVLCACQCTVEYRAGNEAEVRASTELKAKAVKDASARGVTVGNDAFAVLFEKSVAQSVQTLAQKLSLPSQHTGGMSTLGSGRSSSYGGGSAIGGYEHTAHAILRSTGGVLSEEEQRTGRAAYPIPAPLLASRRYDMHRFYANGLSGTPNESGPLPQGQRPNDGHAAQGGSEDRLHSSSTVEHSQDRSGCEDSATIDLRFDSPSTDELPRSLREVSVQPPPVLLPAVAAPMTFSSAVPSSSAVVPNQIASNLAMLDELDKECIKQLKSKDKRNPRFSKEKKKNRYKAFQASLQIAKEGVMAQEDRWMATAFICKRKMAAGEIPAAVKSVMDAAHATEVVLSQGPVFSSDEESDEEGAE